jgi:chromosome segregation ATPase
MTKQEIDKIASEIYNKNKLEQYIEFYEAQKSKNNSDDPFSLENQLKAAKEINYNMGIKLQELEQQLRNREIRIDVVENAHTNSLVENEKLIDSLREIDTHIRSTKEPIPYIIGTLKNILPEYRDN